MLRSVAVTRIQDGLGFATRQSDKIILRLQEAQRDLEHGKTLPKFLLQQDQTLVAVTGTIGIGLPTGFLRIADSPAPFFIGNGAASRTFISVKRSITDMLQANNDVLATGAPTIMVVRKSTVQFPTPTDTNYTIFWSYYKAAQLLTTEIENEWLADASGADWLVGEAGWRMAMDARDKDAVSIFDALRKSGRAACFGEILADEESTGPIVMGANL